VGLSLQTCQILVNSGVRWRGYERVAALLLRRQTRGRVQASQPALHQRVTADASAGSAPDGLFLTSAAPGGLLGPTAARAPSLSLRVWFLFHLNEGDRSLARTRLQPYPARARATRYDGSTKRELCQGGRHGPAACCADAPAAPHAATADAAQAARWWGLPAKRPAAAQGHTPEDDGEFVGPFAALLLRALLLLASHMRPLSSCLAPVCSEL
jgi:hypothetical protein